MNKYDVIYILDPGSTTEEMEVVSSKVEKVIADSKGSILKKDDWGKRRLAYSVKRHRDGHFVFYHVTLPPDAVAELGRNFRLLEKVIKYMIVLDDISHLKAKVKPPRIKTSTTEGPSHGHRPTTGLRTTSAPQAPKPAPETPAVPTAPAAPPVEPA